MASSIKKNNLPGIKVVKKMRDYSNDPFFKKKAEDAIEFLKKHPLPDREKNKNKESK